MSGCVRNIHTKNYQNLTIGFQVTAKNVGDAFLGHSVDHEQETTYAESIGHVAFDQSLTKT